MFGLGIGELILIFVIFLIFFGPDKLPDLAKNLGRAMAELRRTVDELKFDMNSTDYRSAPTSKGPEAAPNLEPPSATVTETTATVAPTDAAPTEGKSTSDPVTASSPTPEQENKNQA